MAWTTPRTWVTGEIVTESMLNEQVRDNLKWLKSAHADASAAVHGAPAAAYMLSTKNGAGRYIEYGSVKITGTGASDETPEASGSWEHAFASACVWAMATVLDASDIFSGRCSISLRSISATGFTVKGGLQYMTGNITVVVAGMGY